jgi:hypothetical protein
MDADKFIYFMRLSNTIDGIVSLDIPWETKYDIIFLHIKPEIDKTGIHIEYADPDTSYEEDTLAYKNAVYEKAKELISVNREMLQDIFNSNF